MQLLGKDYEGNYVIYINENVLQGCCDNDSSILGLSYRAEIARNSYKKNNKFYLSISHLVIKMELFKNGLENWDLFCFTAILM